MASKFKALPVSRNDRIQLSQLQQLLDYEIIMPQPCCNNFRRREYSLWSSIRWREWKEEVKLILGSTNEKNVISGWSCVPSTLPFILLPLLWSSLVLPVLLHREGETGELILCSDLLWQIDTTAPCTTRFNLRDWIVDFYVISTNWKQLSQSPNHGVDGLAITKLKYRWLS